MQVALRAKLQASLEDLVSQEVLTPVSKPTQWISSMVVVTKQNGKLRICLDPKDLNYSVQREHYPLPTIEDIATCLEGAKLFTILDIRNGFWHICLDEKSTMITIYNTPFGQYRWKRLPFRISSALEVFQYRMHQLVEGLSGVEVIADDCVVVGFRDSMEDVIQNHDQNLRRFLQRCEQKDVHLNSEKLQLRKMEVPFIGHDASGDRLKIHPDKVQTTWKCQIQEIQQPYTD